MRIPGLASWAAGRVSSMISKLEKLLGGVRWIIIIQVHGVPYVFQLEECKVVCMYNLSEMDTLMSYCQTREVLEVIAGADLSYCWRTNDVARDLFGCIDITIFTPLRPLMKEGLCFTWKRQQACCIYMRLPSTRAHKA